MVIKIIFGAIIVVFALFFGYNRMSQKSRGGRNIVASLNGANVTQAEFQLAYESQYKIYQQIFQGQKELSPEIEKSVRLNTVNQLIRQKVIGKIGKEMGLQPSSAETADSIKKSNIAQGNDGKFDPYLYKQRFLPFFSQKYNIDYEYLVKNDLLDSKTQDLFIQTNRAPAVKTFYDIEKTSWTFDVSEFDTEASARARKGGRTNKYGDVTVASSPQIFPGEVNVDIYAKVFSLSKGESLKEPVNVSDKWYIIKALDVKRPPDFEKERDDFAKKVSAGQGQEIFHEWVQSVLAASKAKTYME